MPAIICQAVGCACTRRSSQFMCTDHWKRLPMPLRTQINACWRAWRRGEGERDALWLDCIEAWDEAKRWTAEGEGRLGQFVPDAPRIRALRAARAR
ncbi:hypothetical protein [Phenylobacterium sp.]|uniref:hypothetical protein n=1 Tax=Phenylobacterium sp. TaxID=1871053 RepID=UPI0027364B52|nr:hypothetical protein [Phenylobacterium sp.]MDP3853179.1 hypothetical protein [Phenylobacterium sp.]